MDVSLDADVDILQNAELYEAQSSTNNTLQLCANTGNILKRLLSQAWWHMPVSQALWRPEAAG